MFGFFLDNYDLIAFTNVGIAELPWSNVSTVPANSGSAFHREEQSVRVSNLLWMRDFTSKRSVCLFTAHRFVGDCHTNRPSLGETLLIVFSSETSRSLFLHCSAMNGAPYPSWIFHICLRENETHIIYLSIYLIIYHLSVCLHLNSIYFWFERALNEDSTL